MSFIMTLILLLGLTTGCSNVLRSGLVNSNSIFLDPSTNRSVYLQIRNISENQQVTLGDLSTRLASKGYQLLKDPEQANYWVQTKVIYCHKAADKVKPETVAGTGFGSGIGSGGAALPASGGDTGGMMTGMGGLSGMGMTGGMPDINAMMAQAMRGGGYPGMAGPPPSDGVLYLCATDVQITDRRMGQVIGQPATQGSSHPGTPKVQRMRMVGHVLQKELNILEATPIVQEKMSIGIAGMF
ncbi:MAG: complement resistance protein TraT [Nitrospiraceae bacterium]